jgi:exosortase
MAMPGCWSGDVWRRRCWLLVAGSVALGSIARARLSHSQEMALMVMLIWGGALCCMEDQLPQLRPRPKPLGFLGGMALLLLAQWRQERLIQPQSVMLLLPLLQGIGLLLLLSPPRVLRLRLTPLLALGLLPFQDVLAGLMPVPALSQLTARLVQALFFTFGVDVAVEGATVLLASSGVQVAGTCSGSAMLTQLVVVGGIFALVFPLTRGRWRVPALLGVMAVAPLFALLANTLRIALLALLNASSSAQWKWWFVFFHSGEGGLVFSLLAVMAFAPSYFALQDWLLERGVR